MKNCTEYYLNRRRSGGTHFRTPTWTTSDFLCDTGNLEFLKNRKLELFEKWKFFKTIDFDRSSNSVQSRLPTICATKNWNMNWESGFFWFFGDSDNKSSTSRMALSCLRRFVLPVANTCKFLPRLSQLRSIHASLGNKDTISLVTVNMNASAEPCAQFDSCCFYSYNMREL